MEKPYAPTPSTAASQALDELKSLPSFDATRVQFEEAITTITAAATQQLPGIVWTTADNADSGSCPSPYEQTGGTSAYLPNRIATNVTVSEQVWGTLLGVATTAATAVGATDVKVMQDEPGKHDVWFSGPAGAFLKLSYKGNMVVSAYTGCRLA